MANARTSVKTSARAIATRSALVERSAVHAWKHGAPGAAELVESSTFTFHEALDQ